MITPTDWANPLQYDECVVFSTPIGTSGLTSRFARSRSRLGGIESTNGYVWAGVYRDKAMHKLDTSKVSRSR